jgi:hypothetical protein
MRHETEPTTHQVLPDPRIEPVVSVERAGTLLGIGRSCAYNAVKAGEIPSIRLGKRLVVPTAGLLRLLEMAPAEDTSNQSGDAL